MNKISLNEKLALFSEYWRPKTCADEEASILCFEPAGTVNTGNAKDSAYTAQPEAI